MSSLSAPGMSLKAVFEQATLEQLKDLVGPSTCELLAKLGTDLDLQQLSTFASTSLDPVGLLQTESTRHRIFEMLPSDKAEELGRKLGLQASVDWHLALKEASATGSALSSMLSFFGVVAERSASPSAERASPKVEAGYGLFAHQRKAADKVAQQIQHPPNKSLLHMPTGSGKTRTAMHIVAKHLQQREPTLVCWLAQNAELLEQAAEEFEKAWSHLGNRTLDVVRFWGASKESPLDAEDGLIVAGLGKMHAFNSKDLSMAKLASRISLVVMDEAHQATAPTYSELLEALCAGQHDTGLLGLTATPGRTWADIVEDEQLSEFFDQQKVTLEVEGYPDAVAFLMEEGYLAKPTFRTLSLDAVDDVAISAASMTGPDISEAVLESLGNSPQRNFAIVQEAEALAQRHKRIILFAPSVASAQLLRAVLSSRGQEAFVVTAQSPQHERDRAVARFRSDHPKPIILCNYGVLTTGFDAPSTSAALIARPTKSLVLYSQMVGRATRGVRARGNEEAEIVTVADTSLPGFGDVAEAFENWEDVWK